MAGPWEKFQTNPAPVASGPWLQFQNDQSAAPAPSMSGDELRAARAGDTRAQMRLEDIEYAYDTAQARGDRAEQQAMADAYVSREKADSPIFMGLSDRVRGIARGVPILGGAADELNAVTAAPLSALGLTDNGSAYEKALDYQRARDRGFDAAHPKESIALQLGGGLASGVAAAPAAASVLGSLPSTASSLGGAIGLGAASGAADGFARGEGMQGRTEGGIIGGGIGAGVGLVAPMIGKGMSSAYKAVAEAVNANRNLAPLGLSRPAAEVLQRTLEAEGTLGGRGAANIAAAGPDAMLADAGYGSRQLLDTVMQSGGPGASLAREAVENRANAAGHRITAALDQHLGAPVGLQSAEEAIRAGSAPARGAAYDAAYSLPVDYASPAGQRLEALVRSRVPASVINRANGLMRIEGAQSRQILANMADDGTVTFEQLPDVRQLDYIKRALDDVARAGDGAGALGGNTAEGRAYGNLARELRDTLAGAVPEYGTALRTAAEPIAARRALEFGSEMMSPSVSRDEVARMLSGMTPPELAQARAGIRSAIDEKVANVRAVMSDPNVDARQAAQAIKDLSSDAARDKVRLAIGDQAAGDLFRDLDHAGRAFELRAGVARNSATYPRQVMNETINAASDPGPVGLLLRGEVPKASKAVVQALTGLTPGRDVRIGDEVRAQIARALVGTRGPQATDALRRIVEALATSRTSEAAGNALGTLAGGATAGLGYQLGQQLISPELKK